MCIELKQAGMHLFLYCKHPGKAIFSHPGHTGRFVYKVNFYAVIKVRISTTIQISTTIWDRCIEYESPRRSAGGHLAQQGLQGQ